MFDLLTRSHDEKEQDEVVGGTVDVPLPAPCAACSQSQCCLGVSLPSSQTGLVPPGICR